MPYFVYRVLPFAQLEQLGSHASFKEAAARAKACRAEGGAGQVKVMFAEDALQAEDLLCQIRTPGPAGDE
jgi:hypothetical protein